MQTITLSNLENYMTLFENSNTQFNNISWVEPVFKPPSLLNI